MDNNMDMHQQDVQEINADIAAEDIDPRIYDLYDRYCHSDMDRREFLSRAAAITASPPSTASTNPLPSVCRSAPKKHRGDPPPPCDTLPHEGDGGPKVPVHLPERKPSPSQSPPPGRWLWGELGGLPPNIKEDRDDLSTRASKTPAWVARPLRGAPGEPE